MLSNTPFSAGEGETGHVTSQPPHSSVRSTAACLLSLWGDSNRKKAGARTTRVDFLVPRCIYFMAASIFQPFISSLTRGRVWLLVFIFFLKRQKG